MNINVAQFRLQYLRAVSVLIFCIGSYYSVAAVFAANTASIGQDTTYSAAVLVFETGDEGLKELSQKASVLLYSELSTKEGLILVERVELDKALSELELGRSGTVDPATAAQIGHLIGAKVLITGSLLAVGNEVIIVAKVFGTETSRVYSDTVKFQGGGSLAKAIADLAIKVTTTISRNGDTLLAKAEPRENLIARLRKEVEGKKLPSVSIKINEEHVGRSRIIDPTAETEIAYIMQQVGFTLVDPMKATSKPDVEINGEAFSEFGIRKGNLVSCHARVEIKATERGSGKILAVDRQTEIAVDLGEQAAAKTALQKAAAKLAERLVKRLI